MLFEEPHYQNAPPDCALCRPGDRRLRGILAGDWGLFAPPDTTSALPRGTRLCSGSSKLGEGHFSDPRSKNYIIQDPPSRLISTRLGE